MATSSITKNFVITEKSSAERLIEMMFSSTEKTVQDNNRHYYSMMTQEQLKDLFKAYRAEK